MLHFIFQEVHRIRNEHPEDACAVMNDRVKGSLKVTRAFGAGFLKQVFIHVTIASLQPYFLPNFIENFITSHLIMVNINRSTIIYFHLDDSKNLMT